MAIQAGGKAIDESIAFGDGPEDGQAVRNGFITGHPNGAVQLLRGMNYGIHMIARGLTAGKNYRQKANKNEVDLRKRSEMVGLSRCLW